MAYADYTYYVDNFKGAAVSEADFPAAAERASEYIDYITRGRATADMDAVKRACCAMAEIYHAMVKAQTAGVGSGAVAQETVGSYSVTYRSGSDVEAGYRQSLYRAAQMYLAHTGLMYRGGGCLRCTLPTL